MYIPKSVIAATAVIVFLTTFGLLWNVAGHLNVLRQPTISSGRPANTNPGDNTSDKRITNRDSKSLDVSAGSLQIGTHKTVVVDNTEINQSESASYASSRSYNASSNPHTGDEIYIDKSVNTHLASETDDSRKPLADGVYRDADGIVDGSISYDYDDYRNPVRETFDRDGDGIPEASLTYFYEGNGNVDRREFDLDGDGLTNSIYISSFDTDTHTLRQELDSNGDGLADKVYISKYDDSGNRIRREWDFDGDGIIDEAQLNEYYGVGNKARSSRDYITEDKIAGETEMFMHLISITNELAQFSR